MSCSSKRHSTEIGRFLISPKWKRQSWEADKGAPPAPTVLCSAVPPADKVKSDISSTRPHPQASNLFSHLWLQDSPRFAFDLRPFLHHRLRGSRGLLEQDTHLPASSETRVQSVGQEVRGATLQATPCPFELSVVFCALQRILSSKHRGWSMFLTPGEEEVLLSVCEGPTYATTTPHNEKVLLFPGLWCLILNAW